MYGNGVPIGMAIILATPKPIPMALQRGRTAFAVAVAGATARNLVGLRSATPIIQ